MGTANLSCGCSITTSMFGNNEILDIHFCIQHLLGVNSEIKELWDKAHSLEINISSKS